MCWKTKNKELTEPKTAAKPLKTFKVCKECIDPDKVTSYYFSQKYKKGETYTLNGGIKAFCDDFKWPEEYRVDYGFHSYDPDKIRTEKEGSTLVFYNKEDSALDVYALTFYTLYRVECTIPEGATYYENENGEIVSDKIRIDSITEID